MLALLAPCWLHRCCAHSSCISSPRATQVRPHLLLGVDHPTALNFFRFELGLAKESVSTEHLKGHGEVSTCTKCCSGITGSSVNSDKEKGACDHCTSCYNTLTCVKTSDEDKLANFTSSYVSEAYKFKKGMNISVTKWEPDWDAGMKKRGNDAYGKGDTFIGQVYPKRACMRASNAPLDRKHQHLAHRVYTRADYTVYDVNVLVRQWLKDQGAKDSSVAEVLRDKKEHFQKKVPTCLVFNSEVGQYHCCALTARFNPSLCRFSGRCTFRTRRRRRR